MEVLTISTFRNLFENEKRLIPGGDSLILADGDVRGLMHGSKGGNPLDMGGSYAQNALDMGV